MDIDLSLLKHIPLLTTEATLEIRPLAPLSMVSEMPGSYYKSLRYPDKKMVCGLFENLLGWHIDLAVRKVILQEYKKIRKKQKFETENCAFGSTYLPLLMDYFTIEGIPEVNFKSLFFYKDLWSKGYRRSDAWLTHVKGCRNIGFDIVAEKNLLLNNVEKKTSNKSATNDNLQKWFDANSGSIPCFYTSPTHREFIAIDGVYTVSLKLDARLFNMLSQNINKNNLGYLGTSEGWVDIKLC